MEERVSATLVHVVCSEAVFSNILLNVSIALMFSGVGVILMKSKKKSKMESFSSIL